MSRNKKEGVRPGWDVSPRVGSASDPVRGAKARCSPR